MIHVAILMKPYLDAVADGRKRIESRFTITARAPYRAIERGERIYFKQSAGPFRVTARAAHVLFLDDLTPRRMRELKRIYNGALLGKDEFWDGKRDSRYATLVWLRDVEPIRFGPEVKPQRGIAWLTLEDHADVYPKCVDRAARQAKLDFRNGAGSPSNEPCLIRVPLTGGNIRQSHVNVRAVRSCFPRWCFGGSTRTDAARRMLTLDLAGGPTIETDIVDDKSIFRTRRGWRDWFQAHHAKDGDHLIFFPLSSGHYEVRIERQRRRRTRNTTR